MLTASRHITGDKLELASVADSKVVETISATPEHPFFVKGKGWSSLSALGVGTKILVRAGPALVVNSISRQHLLEGVSVYNFEVEGDHTYFAF